MSPVPIEHDAAYWHIAALLAERDRYRKALKTVVGIADACESESDEHQALRDSARIAYEALSSEAGKR